MGFTMNGVIFMGGKFFSRIWRRADDFFIVDEVAIAAVKVPAGYCLFSGSSY